METENTIIDRLKAFMAHSGLSNSQFADKAGIPRPTLSQLLHGRNKSINDMFLRKINETFPQLDVRWLLFGTGSMLSDENMQTSEPQNQLPPTTSDSQRADNQSLFDIEAASADCRENMPEEISSIMAGFSGPNIAPKGQEKDASAGESPFVYEVRPLEGVGADGPDEATPRKKATPRKVTSIIVLYSDGSFETFSPS